MFFISFAHHSAISFQDDLPLSYKIFDFNFVQILLPYWNSVAPFTEIVADVLYITLHLFDCGIPSHFVVGHLVCNWITLDAEHGLTIFLPSLHTLWLQCDI